MKLSGWARRLMPWVLTLEGGPLHGQRVRAALWQPPPGRLDALLPLAARAVLGSGSYQRVTCRGRRMRYRYDTGYPPLNAADVNRWRARFPDWPQALAPLGPVRRRPPVPGAVLVLVAGCAAGCTAAALLGLTGWRFCSAASPCSHLPVRRGARGGAGGGCIPDDVRG